MTGGERVAPALMEDITAVKIAIIHVCIAKIYLFCVIFFSNFFSTDKLQNHKWENAFTVDKASWGFRREAVYNNFLTIEEILEQVVTTVR